MGYVNWDVVLHLDSIPEADFSSDIDADHASCGGSATNTALAMTSFDQPVSLFGGVGEDEYGDRVRDALVAGGVNPELVSKEETTLIYAMITPGDDPRYLARYNGAVSNFEIEEVSDDTWDDAGHVHVTSFSKELSSEMALAANRDGKTVSFNPSQGYEDVSFPDVVAVADVIILNDREAEIFDDRYDLESVVTDGTEIVVTHGSDGSTIYTPDDAADVSHPGFELEENEVVDTIGAGDGFIAGFLSVWVNGGDNDDALSRGNATGAYAVTQVGAPDSVDSDWVQSLIERGSNKDPYY